MSTSDIPEFVQAYPGDVIRAEDWDNVQRQVRSALRAHHHTHVSGTPVNDAATTDEAQQIGTNEIADGAVTSAKLASGAISTANLPDGAVTTSKLADGAVVSGKIATGGVATANIANNAITSGKLSFSTVNNGSLQLAPGGSAEVLVQSAAPSTKTTIYFPTLALTSSAGGGISDITAQIVHRQAVGANTTDVYLRLANSGAATSSIIWQVLTFAS